MNGSSLINNADRIFILLKLWVIGFLPAWMQQAAAWCCVWWPSSAYFQGCLRSRCCWSARGWAGCRIAWPESRWALRNFAAGGRRHQVADQGRPGSQERGWRGAFSGAGVSGGGSVHGLCGAAHGPQHDAGEDGRGAAVLLCDGASTELSVFMAGWSSRNKYSLLGAMRAVAQMISYEVPLLMSSVAVVMITGSLSLEKIVEAQNQYTWGLPHWYIFTPWDLRVCAVRRCRDGGDQSLAV